MATLIPSLGSSVSRMTSGERRLAKRRTSKLDDDYLLWYEVPMGPRNTHPDFCVMHPRRGIPKTVINPLGLWRGGATRRGPHARQGRRRTGRRAGVLCGGDAGYAEAGNMTRNTT